MKPIIRLNIHIKKKDNNRDNTRCFLASLNEEFIDGSQHLIKKAFAQRATVDREEKYNKYHIDI